MARWPTTPPPTTSPRAWGSSSLPIVRVMFPAFAAMLHADRPPRAARLFDWGVRTVALAPLPRRSDPGDLRPRRRCALWLGPEFALHSHAVLRLLALGVYMNCIADGGADAAAELGTPGPRRPSPPGRMPVLPGGPLAPHPRPRHRGRGRGLAGQGRSGHRSSSLSWPGRDCGGSASGARTALLAGGGGLLVLAAGCLLPGLMPRLVFAAATLVGYAFIVWRQAAISRPAGAARDRAGGACRP